MNHPPTRPNSIYAIPLAIKHWAEANSKLVIILFFALFMLLGLSIFRDYGVSFDEGTNMDNGFISLKYVVSKVSPHAADARFPNVPNLHQYKDKDYGVFFTLPSVILQVIFFRNAPDRTAVLLNHLLVFLIFFASAVFFYRICQKKYGDWKIGLLGCLMLIISPRIFAQAFYNAKDVVFMSYCIMSLYTMFNLFRRRDWRSAAWHALACTAAIDVRIMGIIIPFLTFFIILIEIFKAENRKQEFYKWLRLAGIYVVLLAAAVIICWPFLWEAPVKNLALAFSNMSHFRWKYSILFMGKTILATQVPWYYIPVWIGITTPLVYSVLFLIGCGFVTYGVVGNKLKLYADAAQREDIVALLFFFGPLLAVIVLRSVLYNSWRQMYFLYPAFLLLALTGFVELYRSFSTPVIKGALAFALVASMAITTGFMVRNHPFEDVYFSFLPGKTVQLDFEKDYWGLSLRKAYEYILQHDTSKFISIKLCADSTNKVTNNEVLRLNTHILPPADEKRFLFTHSDKDAQWLATTYVSYNGPYDPKKEVYTVWVDDIKILSLFKLK